MAGETLNSGVEQQENGGVNWLLDSLETSVWGTHFKKIFDRFKSTFGFNKKEEIGEQETGQYTSNVTSGNHPFELVKSPIKIDTSGFTPGKYPFAHIWTPYKGIEAYRVNNVQLNPLIGFSQLSLKGTEGPMITLQTKDLALKYKNPKCAGVKKNNPCNVSPFKGDVGRTGSGKVADGQNHGAYNTMEDGLASFMILMRTERYRNKSIQGINCSGMQGVYAENEPISLKALRIIWITHACESLHISPFDRLNTDDKETMMAFVQQTAINETGSYFDRATLERAYNKAFG